MKSPVKTSMYNKGPVGFKNDPDLYVSMCVLGESA